MEDQFRLKAQTFIRQFSVSQFDDYSYAMMCMDAWSSFVDPDTETLTDEQDEIIAELERAHFGRVCEMGSEEAGACSHRDCNRAADDPTGLCVSCEATWSSFDPSTGRCPSCDPDSEEML